MIDVIIVNWNAGALLKACLSSIVQSDNLAFVDQIIVVDNASTDGSPAIAEAFDRVNLIQSNENLGFGKACNLGAKQGKAPYILLLNPDARLASGNLAALCDLMASVEHQRTGICGIQLRDEQLQISRSCTRLPNAKHFFMHALGLDRLWPRQGFFMQDWDHAESRYVDHVIGAYMLIRRDLFEALDGFDERFFLYFEDLDLSQRAKNLGWQTYYWAQISAFHQGGGTSKQIKSKRLFYVLASRLQYAKKHFSKLGYIINLVAILALEPVSRIAYGMAKLSWHEVQQTLQAYAMLYRSLRRKPIN